MAITISSKGYGGSFGGASGVKAVNYGSPAPSIFFAAIIMFVTTMLLWASLFAINFSLQNQKSDLEAKRNEQQSQKRSLKQEETRLLDIQKRLGQIKQLLDTHPDPRLVFDALNQRTRGDVRFASANVNLQMGTIDLNGEAKDYETLASQILAFEHDDQNRFRSIKVEGIHKTEKTPTQDGFVAFHITMDFDKAILSAKDQ